MEAIDVDVADVVEAAAKVAKAAKVVSRETRIVPSIRPLRLRHRKRPAMKARPPVARTSDVAVENAVRARRADT